MFVCLIVLTGTDALSFAGYRACKCLIGHHRTDRFGGCKLCEDGLQCDNDSIVTLKNGYWWKWRNETYKLLYKDFAMSLVNITYSPGKRIDPSIINQSLNKFPHPVPKSYKCPREESCMVKGGHDSLCAVGYQGPLCAVCSHGYYKQFQTCQLCPTKRWMIVQLSIMAAVAVIVFAVIIWTSKRKSKKKEGRSLVDIILCRLKIVIGFYQVTNGVLETFSFIKWPSALDFIGKYSEILQMNVFQVAPIHCLLPNVKMNAFGNLFAILGMNAAAILMASLAYELRKLFLLRSALNKEEKEKKVGQTKEVIYQNLFFLLFVTYLSTCSKTAQVVPLSCRKLCLDEEDKTCDEYLRADYSMNCNSEEYNRSVIVAYCTVFYILFLPTASLIVLWRQRKVLRGNVNHADEEALENEDQATGNEARAENEALEHQAQATGSEIQTENEALEHQPQATGSEIQTENEALEHQPQATGSEIQTEYEALDHRAQATGSEIQTENEALDHEAQATGSEIQIENEALDHEAQATGCEIQIENEALDHEARATESEIQIENEALDHEAQATGSEIQNENEALDHEAQATGSETQAENEALEPQKPATELVTGLRFLFENYNSRAWYWEFVEMFRKFILTSALIFLGGESRAYVGLAFLTSGVYAILFACVSPMADPFENKLMVSSLSVTFVNLAIGAISRIPQENTPSSIDPYLDSIIFNILVFGANTLVISLLVGNY